MERPGWKVRSQNLYNKLNVGQKCPQDFLTFQGFVRKSSTFLTYNCALNFLREGRKNKMMVQFSIMPISDDSHLSEPIAKAVKIIHESGLDYRLTPMGTLIKGEWREVMEVIKKCHETLRQQYDRVMTQIKIDDLKNGEPTFDDKIRSVEEKADMEFKK